MNKEEAHKGPEERSLLLYLHLSCCLVLCFEQIPGASEGSLVLKSVLLVLCYRTLTYERGVRALQWGCLGPVSLGHSPHLFFKRSYMSFGVLFRSVE